MWDLTNTIVPAKLTSNKAKKLLKKKRPKKEDKNNRKFM